MPVRAYGVLPDFTPLPSSHYLLLHAAKANENGESHLIQSSCSDSRHGQITTYKTYGPKLYCNLSNKQKDSTQRPHPTSNGPLRTLAREGHYSKAIQSLSSSGVAQHDDPVALQELIRRHPTGCQPDPNISPPAALTVTDIQVKAAITSFPKGSSPGGSQLRAQHIYDAICGTTTPAAQECLIALTKLINFLLSGRADPRISPWLCGAPLTALRKPDGKSV